MVNRLTTSQNPILKRDLQENSFPIKAEVKDQIHLIIHRRSGIDFHTFCKTTHSYPPTVGEIVQAGFLAQITLWGDGLLHLIMVFPPFSEIHPLFLFHLCLYKQFLALKASFLSPLESYHLLVELISRQESIACLLTYNVFLCWFTGWKGNFVLQLLESKRIG